MLSGVFLELALQSMDGGSALLEFQRLLAAVVDYLFVKSKMAVGAFSREE